MNVRVKWFLSTSLLALLTQPLSANTESMRATIGGGGGESGRCSVQVTVDGSAEVEISGDMGSLRTAGGAPAAWRSFHCTSPIPVNPQNFGIGRLSGRGSIRLVQDPRRTGGRAVVRIDDPQHGAGAYSFELQWNERAVGWPPPLPPRPGWGDVPGGFYGARAIENCKDAVAERLNRDGYRHVNFEHADPSSGHGTGDVVTGAVNGSWGYTLRRFSFSCSVEFGSGRVRTVDVRQRWR
jgi:hypothetical protein